MIAIDWSHTKELTTYDGKKVRAETVKQVITRLLKDGKDGEQSNNTLRSKTGNHSPSAILEQGCPLSLVYQLTSHGIAVELIDNHATEAYRKEYNIEKTDENDARIIYKLGENGAVLREITLGDKAMQMHDIYHQYCRYQKARVAMDNMRKAHMRQYGMSGAGESSVPLKSKVSYHLAPDLSPYDIAVDTLHAREKSLLKKLEDTSKGLPLFDMVSGESNTSYHSTQYINPPAIKGLGQRIWLGILVTANPAHFKCLSAYLRFCGLTEDTFKNSHRYNRHARMLYHMLAEQTLRQKDPVFRPMYDKCKADITEKHPDYTKGHIHNAAMARLSTFLAKDIYKGGHSVLVDKNGT